MTYEEMKAQLSEWLITYPTYADSDCYRFSEVHTLEGISHGRVVLCTATNQYELTFTGGGKSYLGCTSTSRTWLPGEDWHRRSDLPDGSFCKGTFDRIMSRILRHEFVPVRQHAFP